MTDKSVLVFPAGMPSAVAWARGAVRSGMRLVGASSIPHDPARGEYAEWTSLPWIADPGFCDALESCLAEFRLESIFTTHPVVSARLRELLPTLAPDVQLESRHFWSADFANYRGYRELAARFDRRPLQLAVALLPKPPLTPLQFAALVRLFQLTPGQCDIQKLEALAAIFRLVPPGDVVEIGSLWGRSAVVLAQLCRHYRVGKLLCVDPWRQDQIPQGIAELDAVVEEVHIDEVFEGFKINLTPFAGQVNYARMRSIDAASIYGDQRSFTTGDFGASHYTGKIALLHIDGNHALDAVRSDIALWKDWVRPGGWIVFDDYCWSYGDGPKVAADEFCRQFSRCLAGGFVAGDSLFVQVVRRLA